MTRIYGNSAFAWRMDVSTLVAVGAFLYGFVELRMALDAGGGGGSQYGYLFAALFIGGGIYAMQQLVKEYSDTVVNVKLDDATGRGVVTVWRPVVSKRIGGPLDRLTGWRFEEKKVKGDRVIPMLLADHPEHKRPLRLELGGRIALSDALRSLAPDAVAAYEAKGQGGAAS